MAQNSEDALSFFNRLLAQLHQADAERKSSSVQLVYVASGAQYVNNQYNQQTYSAKQRDNDHAIKPGTLPEELCTDQAMMLWQKAQEADYVNEDYQPKLSRTQSALLADAMARRLGIKEKWKVFEALWNRKNMYRDYYKALCLQQSLAFQDAIKRTFT